MLRIALLLALIASVTGCATTHGEVRAAADHDAFGPRAGVSVAARW
ncbi:MAG TPA: hypothetical protein VL096_17065 [Pirellulaceae bacterium]|nr:hypothetical protein [Pirellulaceae bacterium]